MAVVIGKQENTLAWPSRWTVLLATVLVWLPQHRCIVTSDAVCVGQQLSLTCPDRWLIHVIYETYSYSVTLCTTDLDRGTVACTKAEFLTPISVGHCNGRDSCLFTVPANTTISSCNQTATALSVHYKCIPEASVFTICSDVTFDNTEQLYLATPDFPSNILGKQKNCSCTLIGQNINGTVMQQNRDPDSSVIMILSTNRGTQHINGLNILNTIIFSNLTKINLVLENQLDKQVFKIWLGFRGSDMSLKCQYEKPESVTTPAEVYVDPTTSLTTNQNQPISTDQSNMNRTFSLDSNITVTPTKTISSQSNSINCSQNKNSKNIKCENDNTAFGISSGVPSSSLSGVPLSSLSGVPSSSLSGVPLSSLSGVPSSSLSGVPLSSLSGVPSSSLSGVPLSSLSGVPSSSLSGVPLSSLSGVPSSSLSGDPSFALRTTPRTTPVDIMASTGVDLSSQIKSTMQQVTVVTNESPTKSMIFTKTVTWMETVIPSDTTQIQPTTVVENVGTSTVTENLETSTLIGNLGTSITNTATTGVLSSAILNSNQSSPGLQPKTAEEDVALLVIVSCLAFVLLVAMVVFTIVMWRRANSNQYTQEDTHIYDAYHHDNGRVGPDSMGDNHSYRASADESILI